MTNKLEISRELAERIATVLAYLDWYEPARIDAEELRALLAAPVVEPVPTLIQTLHANGDRIAMEATIAQQAQRIADLEAAPVVERQCCTPTAEENELLANGDYTPEELWGGSMPTCPKCIKTDKAVERQEPAAYIVETIDPSNGHLRRRGLHWHSVETLRGTRDFKEWIGENLTKEQPLYTSQPAPVVVLPERKTEVTVGTGWMVAHVEGWNACLDKVKELNQ